MQTISLILILLAMWYWVIAITESDGPLDIFEHLREARFIGGLFSCYICLSIWVSGAMILLQIYLPALLTVSAIAGVFVGVYRLIELVNDTIQINRDEHRLKIAENLAQQINDNYIEEFRNEVYEAYLAGHSIEVSFMIANQKWGDDAE